MAAVDRCCGLRQFATQLHGCVNQNGRASENMGRGAIANTLPQNTYKIKIEKLLKTVTDVKLHTVRTEMIT
eukprot:6483818-Amphidinium_carterae.1